VTFSIAMFGHRSRFVNCGFLSIIQGKLIGRQSFKHPVGTCAMARQDLHGVVDSSLKVYGTKNLRVVDASIIPMHVAAHTQSTTYAIGEKVSRSGPRYPGSCDNDRTIGWHHHQGRLNIAELVQRGPVQRSVTAIVTRLVWLHWSRGFEGRVKMYAGDYRTSMNQGI
jgi:choline dehydrogenase-like flavoprotein